MEWIIITIVIVVTIIVAIAIGFYVFYKDKNIGRKFLYDSEKPFNKTAPSIYYDKQMLFRKYYGLALIVHYILTTLSIVLTTLTIYMVMDQDLNITIRLAVSVLTTICTHLQMVLRLDKLAERYTIAIRTLEIAILKYEQNPEENFDLLVEANKKAEDIAHNNVS